MKLTSPDFFDGGLIPAKHTCNGENLRPKLFLTEVPEEAVSLVITMHDPDVPTSLRADGNWDHWSVWNLPKETREINPEELPKEAVEGITSFGKAGYGGPCPPDREHRYFWRAYALSKTLDLPKETNRFQLEKEITPYVLAEASLVGRYCQPHLLKKD